MLRILFFMFILLSWTVDSAAIVNVESLRQESDQDGFMGRIELSLRGVSGNTRKKGANAGTRLQWKRQNVTHFMILRYSYGESAGNRDTHNSFFHARHIRQLTASRAGEFYIQNETDEFARLSFRRLAGAGERYTLFKKKDQMSAFFGAGVFYAIEKLEDSFGVTDSGTDRFWRASTYFSFNRHINDHTQFMSTTYYQPALSNVSDYRILEEAVIRMKMGKQLMLRLSLDIVHDSQPPQKVEKTDAIYSTGFEYQF